MKKRITIIGGIIQILPGNKNIKIEAKETDTMESNKISLEEFIKELSENSGGVQLFSNN